MPHGAEAGVGLGQRETGQREPEFGVQSLQRAPFAVRFGVRRAGRGVMSNGSPNHSMSAAPPGRQIPAVCSTRHPSLTARNSRYEGGRRRPSRPSAAAIADSSAPGPPRGTTAPAASNAACRQESLRRTVNRAPRGPLRITRGGRLRGPPQRKGKAERSRTCPETPRHDSSRPPFRLTGRLALECAPGRSVADIAAHEAPYRRRPPGCRPAEFVGEWTTGSVASERTYE